MKRLVINTLTVICGLLLTILIINCQNAQSIGDYEPMTKEEKLLLKQQYLDYIEGRE